MNLEIVSESCSKQVPCTHTVIKTVDNVVSEHVYSAARIYNLIKTHNINSFTHTIIDHMLPTSFDIDPICLDETQCKHTVTKMVKLDNNSIRMQKKVYYATEIYFLIIEHNIFITKDELKHFKKNNDISKIEHYVKELNLLHKENQKLKLRADKYESKYITLLDKYKKYNKDDINPNIGSDIIDFFNRNPNLDEYYKINFDSCFESYPCKHYVTHYIKHPDNYISHKTSIYVSTDLLDLIKEKNIKVSSSSMNHLTS